MFSNLKSAFQKAISKEIDESDDYGEDIQAIIISISSVSPSIWHASKSKIIIACMSSP